jgi:hypothetical protein
LWEKLEPILDSKFGGNSSRLEGTTSLMKQKCETSWKTWYNYMSDANKFGNSRNKQQKTDELIYNNIIFILSLCDLMCGIDDNLVVI